MTFVYTVGHSTRSPEAFLAVLRASEISHLADVRRFPGSRRHPHFAKDALRAFLERRGIAYTHQEALGGRRPRRDPSPNTFWRNAGFRGYADYMGTDAFRDALDALIALAEHDRVAVMCAEAVPWRCHRNLLADALVVRGVTVRHLLAADRTDEHVLHPAARVDARGGITYPAEPAAQIQLFAP